MTGPRATTAPRRLAGSGRWGDRTVVWTMSEGRRGRRWREVVTRDGAIVHSLLLETGPDRRFSHLELSTGGVLLTLHPEPDGTLHGNRVDRDGIQHITGVAFDPDGPVLIDESVIAAAAAAWQETSSDRGAPLRMVVIDGAARVSIVDGASPIPLVVVAIDADGVPQLHDERVDPLEA
jgi:hypothetical protein